MTPLSTRTEISPTHTRFYIVAAACMAALFLSGCATPEGKVLASVEDGNLKRLQESYGTSDALKKKIADATGDSTGVKRNELLGDLVLLIDLNYGHWEKLVYDKKAYADFGSAVTATTLSTVSSLSKVEDVKTVLSAISGGITSTSATFNSKVLQDQSLTAILAKMRANRSTQLLKLQAGMIDKDTKKANPLATYSVQQGLVDLAAYYNAGTFVAALQDIVEKAAEEKKQSDEKLKQLAPNTQLLKQTPTLPGG